MTDGISVNGDAWIQTNSGISFSLNNPQVNQLSILDVVNSLSKICRFTGHTDSFYSVAQHCVLVSYFTKPENAFTALMHDFTEAYLGDVATPLKNLLPEYKELETKLWLVGVEKWGLPEKIPEDVKEADKLLLNVEGSLLFSKPIPCIWDMEEVGFVTSQLSGKAPVMPLEPREAKQLFIERYLELREL